MTENEEKENLIAADEEPAKEEPAEEPVEAHVPKKYGARLSGAYWYVPTDSDKLIKYGAIRNLLSITALMLQLLILALPWGTGGKWYATNNIQSLAYFYVFCIFLTAVVAIYVIVMNYTRYKLIKRIPKEFAPKNGFKYRAFLGNELYIASNALIFVLELVFLCIRYNGMGLLCMFISALALGAAITARQLTHIALSPAELVPAAEENRQ